MMENDDDVDAKLTEEIEAELDKISISSLEKDDIDCDSKSETPSDDSDSDVAELPESVLHCINIIENKSKTAEELILQDFEDNDSLSYCYRGVGNNHRHLKIKLSSEYEENPEQLIKILSEIEKEEFLRSKTYCASPASVPEPFPHDSPVDNHVFSDDIDINFDYHEVEERCRQTFKAWQDKQKALEDQEKEILKAQKAREEKQFQEDEEKRLCWLQQFEVEKKKLENTHKQEQDKMNDQLQQEEKMWEEKLKLHEEFMENLHIQMEEERAILQDLQEKEKIHLSKLQQNAAINIQANYKAFAAYKKYNPVIKEQVENKKKKAQEWKEKEAKIRQWEEDKRKRLEEQQRIEEEEKKQKEKELRKRQKEYEEKKSILRLEREQELLKEKFRTREVANKQFTSETLRKGVYNTKHLPVGDTPMNHDDLAKELLDKKLKKQEDTPLWLVTEKKSKLGNNVSRSLVLKESVQEQLKECILKDTILTELKDEVKNENLAEQQSTERFINLKKQYEIRNNQVDLVGSDLKENVNEDLKLQELKSQIQTEGNLKYAIDENVGQETQILVMVGHNKKMHETENSEAQKQMENNKQEKVHKLDKENILEENGTLYEQTSVASRKQLLSLKLENCENMGKDNVLQEVDFKSSEIKKNSEDNALNSEIEILNTSDSTINLESKIIKKQDYVFDRQPLCESSSDHTVKSSLVSKGTHCVQYEIKEILEDYHENRSEGSMACSLPELSFLSAIEEKRLAWIKSFKPWFEIFKKHQQKKIVGRKRFIKCLTNTMPPLNAQEILQCGPWNTLQQVTTVNFQDLPGCSLSTLAECANLQFLSLQHCGLTSLHSLSNCKNLKYIDVQENHIETINCENLENLCILLLNKNQLNSLHGLDGCTNIQNLELSYNKITRIGGLESLKNLQQLILDHNQLISTKGLSDTPTIVYLDCSHNHLTEVEGIANCGLLQILKLQGNYLSQVPSLENHVLLRELHLDDNSISTVEIFSSYWLPLLQNLTLSQNSLTELIPLFHFVSLEKLDVSNNCLSDLTSAIRWFEACFSIHELSLTGNPLLQETNWRHSLLKMLPALRVLNDEVLNSYSESHIKDQYQLKSGCFLAFCQSQLREFNLLTENYITGKGNIVSLDDAENIYSYFNKLMKLSNEYRFAHETMDVRTTEEDKSEVQENNLAHPKTDNLVQSRGLNSCLNENKSESPDLSEIWTNSGSSAFPQANPSICSGIEERSQVKTVDQKREDGQGSNIFPEKIAFTETQLTMSLLTNCQNIQPHKKIMAAIIIQAYWRGYLVRKQIPFSARLQTAATGHQEAQPNSCSESEIVSKEEKPGPIVNTLEKREEAAILIQAIWKGFLLRKKLTTALEAIKNEDYEEYEEIDLKDFTYDEAALEKEWLALDSTRFPSQTQLPSNQLHWPKYSGALKYEDTSLNLSGHPAQAWLHIEKENTISPEHTQLNSSKPENRTSFWTPESKSSRKSLLKSAKEKQISEEWGFKDISTAQQMLKRAQKMKSNKSSGKKGKEEGSLCEDITANEKIQRRREYTYQWLHTQVGVHETTSSRNMKCNHFLPELDPDVRNGGRVQLVARLVSREDTDLDLFSMASGSTLSMNRGKKNQAHRHSAGSSSCSNKGILAPMITNTGPSKKERISFRDNPVQLSGGWGSGKKKEKTSN
ncbi:leucine-rich repeat- and IQ domain-containing protein 1 [Rhynchocyon petersi]